MRIRSAAMVVFALGCSGGGGEETSSSSAASSAAASTSSSSGGASSAAASSGGASSAAASSSASATASSTGGVTSSSSSSSSSSAAVSSSSSVAASSSAAAATASSSSGSAGVAACAGAGDADAPDLDGAFSQAQQDAMVRAHNNVRCNTEPAPADMPAVTWDPLLAQVAQTYAERCQWEHNDGRNSEYQALGGSGSVGENLFGASYGPSPADVVDLWAAEVADYDLETNSCSDVCGHYTQIVWANSVRIGCGAATGCNGFPSVIVVCNYSPAGNYVGQRPYQAAP